MKTQTKEFRLNLSAYQIEVDKPELDPKTMTVIGTIKKSIAYPLRRNYSNWLRTIGMFSTAEDVVKAVALAKSIRDSVPDDYIILNEKEAAILKRVLDRHLVLAAEGRSNLGGELHEEAICRVVNMEVIEE